MSAAKRRCDYCDEDPKGPLVAVEPGNPKAKRAAVRHDSCYAKHVQGMEPGPEAMRRLAGAAD